MKKLLVAALMVLSTSAAFAGPSEALKAIQKAKTYAEAEQLVKSSLSSLANDEEKATAYNKLASLALETVEGQTKIVTENQLAQQMGTATKDVNYDALYGALPLAISAAEECYKYDQLPNAKGKVKPKYSDKLASTLYNLRGELLNGGIYYQDKDKAKAVELAELYCETSTSKLFSGVKQAEDPNIVVAGYLASFLSYQNQSYAKAEKYAEYALNDSAYGQQALQIKMDAMKHQCTTHADSVTYVEKVKTLYQKMPDNQFIFASLVDGYSNLGDQAAADKVVADRLAVAPNDFLALYVKGQFLFYGRNFEEAASYLEKALANAPEINKLGVTAMLGDCQFYHAQERLDAVKGALSAAAKQQFVPVFQKAVDYYEAAKKLDVDGAQKSAYAARLYNCYYFIYGENDAHTQEAKAYAGY